MAFHASLHNVRSMVPMSDPTGSVTWLDVKDNMGNEVGIFMPLAVAERIAAVFAVETTVEPSGTCLDDILMTTADYADRQELIEIFDDIPAKPSDYTEANLADLDDGNITP